MTVQELVKDIPNFSEWSHADKIKLFAWFIHSQLEKDRFAPADIRSCYGVLSMDQPRDINPYLSHMLNRKPREVLRDKQGYALEKRVRDQHEDKYGKRLATILVDKLLLDLPAKIPNMAERIYLDETIKCFRCGAFRATIIMAWNLAFDHFCHYIFGDAGRLRAFNEQLPKSFPKEKIHKVSLLADFEELKESQILQVSRSAVVISNDLFKILKEKLDKRNSAAHPSTIEIGPHTAEEYVIDLITNGVLKLTVP